MSITDMLFVANCGFYWIFLNLSVELYLIECIRMCS